jgi:hypothetical protein
MNSKKVMNKTKKEQKGFFDLSQIKLAQSSVKFGDTDIKNSVLSLKLMQEKSYVTPKGKRNESLQKAEQKNFNSSQRQGKSTNNYNSKRDLTSSIYSKPLAEKNKNLIIKNNIPKIKDQYKDQYYKSIEDYRTIFGNGENLKINLQQMKLMMSQLGLIGNVEKDWSIENQEDKKLVDLLFTFLEENEDAHVDFSLLQIFLILLHHINTLQIDIGKFNTPKQKNIVEKNILKNTLQIPVELKKNDFSFSKKTYVDENSSEIQMKKKSKEKKTDSKPLFKRMSDSYNESNNLMKFNREINESIDTHKNNLNFSQYKVDKNSDNLNSSDVKKDIFLEIDLSKKSKFQMQSMSKIKNPKLFSADINVGDQKKTIEIRELDNIELVASQFSKKYQLSDKQHKKLLKVLLTKKEQVLFKQKNQSN